MILHSRTQAVHIRTTSSFPVNNWKDRPDHKTSGYEQLNSSQANVAINNNNPNAMRNMMGKKTRKCTGGGLVMNEWEWFSLWNKGNLAAQNYVCSKKCCCFRSLQRSWLQPPQESSGALWRFQGIKMRLPKKQTKKMLGEYIISYSCGMRT